MKDMLHFFQKNTFSYSSQSDLIFREVCLDPFLDIPLCRTKRRWSSWILSRRIIISRAPTRNTHLYISSLFGIVRSNICMMSCLSGWTPFLCLICQPKGFLNHVLMITNLMLLIGLNYKEFPVLVWKFIKELNGCKIKTIERLLIIGNICKMNAGVHLEFSYFFMHF